MTEPEYRQDDRRDVGYCPRCGTPLSALTTEARGWCDDHGWQPADWEPRISPSFDLCPDEDWGDEREAQP